MDDDYGYGLSPSTWGFDAEADGTFGEWED